MFIMSYFLTDRNGADFATHQDTPVAAYRLDTYVVFNVDVYYFPTDRNGADFITYQDTPVAAYTQDTYVVFNVDVYYFPTDRMELILLPTKIRQ